MSTSLRPVELLHRCHFPPAGANVVCAVSGGPDSLALLVLACAADLHVTAVHVDHGLRVGSAEEADVVRSASARFGAGFVARRSVVEPGPNLEARARAARYEVLPPGSLLGHTADDQAETVLLHLLRGSGLHGAAAMRRDGRRPLLDLRRRETELLCQSLELEVVRDPSNEDRTVRRNRVRHELLPLLGDIAERDPVPVLCRFADIARDASDHLDEGAATIDVFDAEALRDAPPVLAALAVRSWLRSMDGCSHPPDAATIERVLAVARHEATATDVGQGWQVRRTAGRLRLERLHLERP